MEIDVVIDSENGRRVERISAVDPVSIGRSPQCALRLESDLVSRRHALVHVGTGTLYIEDLSTNGTLAGHQLLRRDSAQISFGTPVVVGDFTLTIHPAGQAHNVAPPSGSGVVPPQADWGATPGARLLESNLPPPVVEVLQAPPSPPRPPLAPQCELPPVPMPVRRPGFVPPAPRADRTKARPKAKPPTAVVARGLTQDPGPPTVEMRLKQPLGSREFSPAAALTTEAKRKAAQDDVALRRKIHEQLLPHLGLAEMDAWKLDDSSIRPKVLIALRRIIGDLRAQLPADTNLDQLVGELADEALGLGPLERYLTDPSISEVMVVGPDAIYVESEGRLERTESRFTDDERVRAAIERIVTPLGHRIDESSPMVNARLKDGSRVHAVIKPIALRGSCITIRKFARTPMTLLELIGLGTCSEAVGRFLQRCVAAKRNVVISGGANSGKTTLLNVLSAAISEDERIITIEDAAELRLAQPHVVSLEALPAHMEGGGQYTIRDLVRNALQMRPDRIIVGECRGGEALDVLQAMNTGHDGSLTTIQANSPEEALARLETLASMAGVDVPSRAIRDQIVTGVHVIVQQSRFADGTRRVTQVAEVVRPRDDESIELLPIFEFQRTETSHDGRVLGRFQSTGYLPSFLDQFIMMGLVRPGEPYL